MTSLYGLCGFCVNSGHSMVSLCGFCVNSGYSKVMKRLRSVFFLHFQDIMAFLHVMLAVHRFMVYFLFTTAICMTIFGEKGFGETILSGLQGGLVANGALRTPTKFKKLLHGSVDSVDEPTPTHKTYSKRAQYILSAILVRFFFFFFFFFFFLLFSCCFFFIILGITLFLFHYENMPIQTY